MKRVRMLVDRTVDGLQYRCNQVVDFPDGVAKALIEDGAVDPGKAAVAYCLNELSIRPLVHENEAVRAAKAELDAAVKVDEEARAAAEAETDAEKRAALLKVADDAGAALKALNDKLNADPRLQ